MGPHCLSLVETLFADHVLDHLRAAQGVIGFRKRYDDLRLEQACQRALAFDTYQYSTVKQILKKGVD